MTLLEKRRQSVILILAIISSLFLGTILATVKVTKIGIGYGYVLRKQMGNTAISKHPNGEKITQVESFIVDSGLVFGNTEGGDYFCLYQSKIKYFDKYEDQLAFARARGVVITESKYIEFLTGAK